MKQTKGREVYVPKSGVRPTPAQVAAAKLILKRDREGKGHVTITPKIRYLASYSD